MIPEIAQPEEVTPAVQQDEEVKGETIDEVSKIEQIEEKPSKESLVPARLPIVIDSEKFSQSIMESLRMELLMKEAIPSIMNAEGEDQ